MTVSKPIKIGAAILLLGAAAVIAVGWGRGGRGNGVTKYLYDLSEKKLYAAPASAFAPEPGIGGASDDAVEAVVLFCPECGRDKPQIAYLETHTPEYKAKRTAAQKAGVGVEGITHAYILKNTLVRAVDGDKWYVADTPEAVEIARRGRSVCSIHGAPRESLAP